MSGKRRIDLLSGVIETIIGSPVTYKKDGGVDNEIIFDAKKIPPDSLHKLSFAKI